MAALESAEDQRLKGPFEKNGFGSSIPRFYRSPMHVQGLDYPVKLLLQQRERHAALLQSEQARSQVAVQRSGWHHAGSPKRRRDSAGENTKARVEGDATEAGGGVRKGASPGHSRGQRHRRLASPDGQAGRARSPHGHGDTSQHGSADWSEPGDHKADADTNGGALVQPPGGDARSHAGDTAAGEAGPAEDSRPPSPGALAQLVRTTAGLNQYSVRPTTAGVTIRGEPGPGAYVVRSGTHVTAGVRVVDPQKESFAFRASSKRFRKHQANPVFVPRTLHDEAYDKREWANPRHASTFTFAHSERVTMQSPGAGRRPSTAHLFYSTMAEAPTDISRRLHTTPVRYAAGARTKFTRFPMSQLHPQYSVPIGPGSFGVMASYDRVGVPHDPVRGSAVFRSSSTRFPAPPKRELVGDDWHYEIFDAKIQVGRQARCGCCVQVRSVHFLWALVLCGAVHQPWSSRDTATFTRAKRRVSEK